MEVIKVNDLVVIISPCQTQGMEGIVKKISNIYNNKYISVYIPEISETRSYNALSIQLIKGREENKMNNKYSDCNEIVGVKFLQGYNMTKEYYFASYENNLKIDSIVLCDTEQGFGIGKVVNIYDKESTTLNPTKEIITIVNMDAFNNRKELRAKKDELKKKMDRRVKELQNIAVYELLAEKDSVLAEMLKEFHSL